MSDRVEVLALFPDLEDLVAHYACRTGGVSESPFASLNLGFSTRDEPARVVENRRRLSEVLEAPLDRWVVGGQVHGAEVNVAGPALAGEGALEPSPRLTPADAVFLPEPGVFGLALSADCPLVAVVAPETRQVGVAHAGWRGTAAGVIEALVRAFDGAGSPPETLRAAVSPGICDGCYPVGEEVFTELAGCPGLAAARAGDHLDLRVIHRGILGSLGLRDEAIEVSPRCSSCEPRDFFSHRRDQGRTGRNGALVGWR